MEFDLTNKHRKHAYKLLANLVTPRPIAWTTTHSQQGIVNAAPFSFFNVFGTKPPIVALAPGDRTPGIPKDTARNIRTSGELVINLVDEDCAEEMNLTATDLPPEQSETEAYQLELAPSSVVAVPRIAKAPVALECREHTTLRIGQNRLIIAEVLHLHVRDGLIDPDTLAIDPLAYRSIGRMGSPDYYCHTTHLFKMPRL